MKAGNWVACLLLLFVLRCGDVAARERWPVEKANRWHEQQAWLVGCNFVPSTAINQLEMWQADTFDPETIDRELGWAAQLGFNSLRVFLHDIPWREDRAGFFTRIDRFLDICQTHNLGVMFVLFDGVWDPDPQSGLQRRPRTGVHNSGWVQSPGRVILADPAKQDQLQEYVRDTISRYRRDPRVQVWDLFNEPDNANNNSYGPLELPNKDEAAARLTRKSFAWAREIDTIQPLTVGVWTGSAWDKPSELSESQRAAVELSDVISFHSYGAADATARRIRQLQTYKRPLLCTEFMARGRGNTFEAILPLLKEHRIAAYCWGLVDGKSQTKFPWDSWEKPYLGEPDPWHHDIFHADGSAYSDEEVTLIRALRRP